MKSGTQQSQSQPLLGNQNKQLTNRNKQLTNRNKQLTNQQENKQQPLLGNQNKQLTNQNKQLINQNKNKQPTNQNKQLTNRNKQLTNQNKQNQNKNQQPTKTGGKWIRTAIIISIFLIVLLAIILSIMFVKKNKDSIIIEYQKPLLKKFGEYNVIMKNNKIDKTIPVDTTFESPSKEYNVKFQSDGNIVVYHSTKSPKATGTQWFALSPPPIYTFTSKGQIIITGKSDKNDLKIDKKIYNIGDDITYTIRSSGNTLVIDNNGNVFVMNT